MAVARATADTLATLATRVAREVGDSGNTEFTLVSDVYPAINDMLIEMGNHLALRHTGEAMLYVDFTYSSTGDPPVPVDLPAGILDAQVFRMQDYTRTTAPQEIPYVSPLEMADYGNAEIVSSTRGRLRYTLFGPTTDHNTHRVLLTPRPQGSVEVRVHYVATPFIFNPILTTDTHPLSADWRETIWLGASIKLLRRDGEATMEQIRQFEGRLWPQFVRHSNRQRGPQRVRRRRRGIS